MTALDIMLLLFALLVGAGGIATALYLIGSVFEVDKLTKNHKNFLIRSLERPLGRHGFRKVTKHFNGEAKQTTIALFERFDGGEECAWIELCFDKYKNRKFQVFMGVTESKPPFKYKRTGRLVRKSSQYFYFWGVRFWLFFPNRAWTNASRQVEKCIPQIIEFVDTGQTERNIRAEIRKY